MCRGRQICQGSLIDPRYRDLIELHKLKVSSDPSEDQNTLWGGALKYRNMKNIEMILILDYI